MFLTILARMLPTIVRLLISHVRWNFAHECQILGMPTAMNPRKECRALIGNQTEIKENRLSAKLGGCRKKPAGSKLLHHSILYSYARSPGQAQEALMGKKKMASFLKNSAVGNDENMWCKVCVHMESI